MKRYFRSNQELVLTFVGTEYERQQIIRTIDLILATSIDDYEKCEFTFIDNSILFDSEHSKYITILSMKVFEKKYLYFYDAVRIVLKDYISDIQIRI